MRLHLKLSGLLIAIMLGIIVNSCESDKKKAPITDITNEPLFTLTNPEDTGIDFTNLALSNHTLILSSNNSIVCITFMDIKTMLENFVYHKNLHAFNT